MLLFTSLIIILIISVLVYWYKRTYTYWQRHGIPYIKPLPIIGTLWDVFTLKKNVGLHIGDIYNNRKMQNEPVVGIYMLHQPALLIRDPQLLKSIFIKDFNNFHDRYANCDIKVDPFGAMNMFMAKYNIWSEIRPKLSPVFTSGKLKHMFPFMLEICTALDNYLLAKGDSFTCDVKSICGQYTTDQISSTAFGIQTNSFENPENEFVIQNAENSETRPSIKFAIIFLLPKFSGLFRSELFTRKYQNFLKSCMKRVMLERQRSGDKRQDFIDAFLQLRKDAKRNNEDIRLYDELLFAQGGIFYLAGYETTRSLMAHTLFLLAKHQTIQRRLRLEIKNSLEKHDGNITYDSLKSLSYLDMVVHESLRLYPVVTYLDRECNNAAGKSFLRPYYDFVIPSGMPVFISTIGMHRDPKFWPNPDLFDPERFAPEKSIPEYVYMPFGIGPRNCIGFRLALIQTKLGLLHFLKNFELHECGDTAKVIAYAPNTFTLEPVGGVYLKFTKDVLWMK